MWQRFTEPAKKIVFYAQVAADERGRTDVASEHLLLGLLREVSEEKSVWPPAPTDRVNPHDIAASLLRNVDIDKLLAATDQQITLLNLPTSKTPEDVDLLPSGKRVIDAAYGEARRLSAENITPEFLLLGLFGPRTGGTASLLTETGLDLETARREVASVYQPAQENKVREDSAEKDSAEKDSAEKDSAEKDSAEKDSAEKDSAEKDKPTLWSRLFAKRTTAPGEKDTR